jgi:hypothetical protein
MRERWLVSGAICLLMTEIIIARATPPIVTPFNCATKSWKVLTTGDSTLELCAPQDFAQVRQSGFWTRAQPGVQPPIVGDEWIHVQAYSASEMFNEVERPWPPSLMRDTSLVCVDCLNVTNYQVHWERVGERIVRLETGRVSGGYPGFHDQPMVQAAWMVDSTRWVFVFGQASTDHGIDELRQILRTIRPRERVR